MKKYTIFSACALACLTMRAAELDGVRYGGYTTNAVPVGFSILAVPFSGFDTASFVSTNLSLESLISTNGLTIGDRLIAFNESNTNYYYYALTASGWDPLDVAEIGTDSTNHVVIVTGPPLSELLKAQGYAFWLKTTSATTAYLQGVVNTNEVTVPVVANSFTLIGNALPTSLNLNAPAFTNANAWCTPYPVESGDGDEIHVVNGSGYVVNVFLDGTWINASSYAISDEIPAGSGMWYLRRGDSQTLKLK